MHSLTYLSLLRHLTSRSAWLLALGLSLGSCEKILDQEPQNSIDATTAFKTRQDVEAGLRGAYDALQSANYFGIRYQSFADLISGNIAHTGTFPTFAQIGQNQILPDNTDVRAVWIAIYAGIARANSLIQNAALLVDPSYNTAAATGEARALRAFHYMNLLGFWGGSSQGYGYSDGLGVPLRLTFDNNVDPIPRSTEAEVIEAIRTDLDFAAQNLPNTNAAGNRLTKGAALALRARLELRLRNYADALKYANQVQPTGSYNVTTADVIFQLAFSVTDANQLAFFWFPSASGGRNEFDPGAGLTAAHPTGDTRLPINVVTSANSTTANPAGTTRKYSRISSNDDPVNLIRYSEVALTIAEAAAQTGDLGTATTQVNLIRSKSGLTPIATGMTQTALLQEILLQRRLELAHEGHYWFDLRRTNTVQTAIPAFTQTFRNLWPIPQQEILNSNGIIEKNPNY